MSSTGHLYSQFFHWEERSAMARWQNRVLQGIIYKWCLQNSLKVKCVTLKRMKLIDQMSQMDKMHEALFYIVQQLFNPEGLFYLHIYQNSVIKSLPCKSCDKILQEVEVLHLGETILPVSG